jgi:hypothetical protein
MVVLGRGARWNYVCDSLSANGDAHLLACRDGP